MSIAELIGAASLLELDCIKFRNFDRLEILQFRFPGRSSALSIWVYNKAV